MEIMLFADNGPRDAISLGRPILWFQKASLSHSVGEKQGLGPAVE